MVIQLVLKFVPEILECRIVFQNLLLNPVFRSGGALVRVYQTDRHVERVLEIFAKMIPHGRKLADERCVGYVPTTEAPGENGGGYETRLTAYSNLIPTAGDQIRDKGIELSNSMKPGPVPEGSPTPEFKTGWQYGDVPPELE